MSVLVNLYFIHLHVDTERGEIATIYKITRVATLHR